MPTVRSKAISELARRILRSSGATIEHSGELIDWVHTLSLELSDISPKMINGINSKIVETEYVKIVQKPPEFGGIISRQPPVDEQVIWIESGDNVFAELRNTILELARAGYPGCVGCAGPAAEEPWNEAESRGAQVANN